ncbi:Copper-transporting ATPase PAA2 [Sarracenia purpurea var. burkii]
MTTDLLRISLSPQPKLTSYLTHSNVHRSRFNQLLQKRHRTVIFRPETSRKVPSIVLAKAVEFKAPPQNSPEFPPPQQQRDESPALLDVAGMMCGACVSRVKSILSSDERVDSVVVNMLTDTAAVRLKTGVETTVNVAEDLARRLTECGFPAKRRVSGLGIQEKVRKWKEMVEKKEALLVESRTRVAFAWTLVALCCGSHASHILHSLGIHVAHGNMNLKTHISIFVQIIED